MILHNVQAYVLWVSCVVDDGGGLRVHAGVENAYGCKAIDATHQICATSLPATCCHAQPKHTDHSILLHLGEAVGRAREALLHPLPGQDPSE